MKAGYKALADGNYEIIVEAQNVDEDQVVLNVFNTGGMMAVGETAHGRKYIVLRTEPAT